MPDNDQTTPDQQQNPAGDVTPQAPGQTPDQQRTPAGDTTPQTPGQNSGQQDWETRYKGQQVVLQQKVEELKTVKAQSHDLNVALEGIRTQLAELTSNRQAAEEQMQALQSQVQQAQAKEAKMQLVREKFPTLLRFDPAVLPSGEGEDLERALTAINDTVTGIVAEQTQAYKAQITQGSVPTPPASVSSPPLTQAVQDALTKALDSAGTPDFTKFWNQYIALQQKADEKSGAMARYTLSDDDDFGSTGVADLPDTL